MLCFDVNGLRVGRCVTERLHGEIRGEAETRKILQFVPCHRSCGVLRTDSCHFGFAVGAGSNSFNTTGAPYHFLCKADLRAAAAMVLAGLSAKGITEVAGLEHLDRGYDDLEAKLSAAGAEVKRNIL